MRPTMLARRVHKPLLASSRAFTCSAQQFAYGKTQAEESQTVAPDRNHRLDIQADASKQAKENKAQGNTQDQAATQTDSRDSNARAEKDFPNAPKPVIGMNDERGGKGH